MHIRLPERSRAPLPQSRCALGWGPRRSRPAASGNDTSVRHRFFTRRATRDTAVTSRGRARSAQLPNLSDLVGIGISVFENPYAAPLVPILEMPASETSRCERNSVGLPRLEDDPRWSPPTFDFRCPILEDAPPRRFDRFRRWKTDAVAPTAR